ncbi:hypothetical protein K491DRAFT_279713 [Lophiostoma macrostomum CBS 122681]|uniref:Cora-domain-containing protein n=1 Tax=Lophiostoma macrostomum CBS 122681 TaxID=1314788 RepID=A0A6A6TT17_9PLEO|nr:hypothetical protein K491DRAFT_279713 [Lophiostoma macrostomum CBS 122681]
MVSRVAIISVLGITCTPVSCIQVRGGSYISIASMHAIRRSAHRLASQSGGGVNYNPFARVGSRETPRLFETTTQAKEDEALSSPFVKSIPARYRRYLSNEHGLVFSSASLDVKGIAVALGGAGDHLEIKHVSDKDIPAWISIPIATSFSPRLHLIIGIEKEYSDSSVMIPLSKESFLKIMEQFDLPYPYLQSLFTGTARSLRYADSKAHPQRFVYRTPISRSENWALSFSQDLRSGTVKGLLLGMREDEFETFQQYLIASRRDLRHSMCLPLILCEMQTTSDTTEIKRHSSSLFEIELQTQMHAYDFVGPLGFPQDLDYDKITRSLNGIISRLAFHQMRLETTLRSLEYIKGCETNFRPAVTSGDEFVGITESLSDRIEQVSDENRVLLEEVQCNQRIAQSQLDAVYNLVVQRDSRTSRDIAQAAKEDSAAMRTLALMSILFLPATFVSSFFSMTMFDWQAERWSEVVSQRLWLYWVVSIPLTLIILTIWYFWHRRDIDGEFTIRRKLQRNLFGDSIETGDDGETRISHQKSRQSDYEYGLQQIGEVKHLSKTHTGQGPRR